MDRDAQSLERLPLLVLERICHYVDDEGDTAASNGDNRQSLWALARVSRRCANATSTQRFCQLHVRLVERDTVQATVDDVLERLGQRVRHVRRLRLSGGTTKNAAEYRARTGEVPPADYGRGRGENGRWHEAYNEVAGAHRSNDTDDPLGWTHNSGWDMRHAFAGGVNGIHPFCRPRWARKAWLEEDVYGLTHDHNAFTMVHDKDPAWDAVAGLIQSLPGLRDLVWNCATYVPDAVLVAIQSAPALRLHMHQFVLHSLTQFVHHAQHTNVGARDYALASSPQLVSLAARVNRRLLMGRVNYTSDALPAMMRGLAPNLQHVWIDEVSPNPFFSGVGWGEEEEEDASDQSDGEDGADGQGQPWHRELPRWQGFFPEGAPEGREDEDSDKHPKGLSSLVLWRDVTTRMLNNVLACSSVDLACVRHLTLFWRQRTVLSLVQLARSRQLAALDHFTLLQATDGVWVELAPGQYSPGEYDMLGECIGIAAEVDPSRGIDVNLNNVLFRNLPPLRRLHYTGALLHTTARRIYRSHGPTLRALALHTPAVPPHLVDDPVVWLTYVDRYAVDSDINLVGACPHLEELHVNMRRMHGNADEVAVYRALSRLPQLERLFVKLHYRLQFVRPPLQATGDELAVRRFGYRAGQVPTDVMEDVYSNCALDATLARSIFDVVDAGKGCLRHLRLDIQREAGVQDVGMSDYTFMDMLRWLARPQTVRRTACGDVVVSETNQTATDVARAAWDGLGGSSDYERHDDEENQERPEKDYKLRNCRDAFRRVWPPKQRKTQWWLDWMSLPLELGDETMKE